MKRIIFGIFWTLISINAFSVSADFYVNGIGYTVVSFTGNLTCSVSDGTSCRGGITIPETVTHQGRTLKVVGIDYCSFMGNTELTSIILPETISGIGLGAFKGCIALQSIKLPTNCFIDDGSFENCSSLTSIVLPNDTGTIPPECFKGCTSLESVETQNGVGFRLIRESAFENCSSLSSIKFSEPIISYDESYDFDWNSSFEEIWTLEDDYGNFKCKIGNPLDIREKAFKGCSSLSSIVIPNGTKPIGDAAFADCSIKSLTIYDGCGSLGIYLYTFEGSNIEELITDNFFPLELRINPRTLKRLVSNVFYDDSYYWSPDQEWEDFENLEELVSLSLEPPRIDDSFSNNQYLNLKVIVPTEALEAYQQADVWKNFWHLQGGATTGINAPTVNSNGVNAPIYDIGGRKVMETVKGQVYIKNGKKFIAR